MRMLKKSHQTLINSGKVTEVTKGNRRGNRYKWLYIYIIDIIYIIVTLVTSFLRVLCKIYIYSLFKKYFEQKKYIYTVGCLLCVCLR